ncbi:single-stranded DNA-binding protein [Acetobacterium wieringae]|uniref:single-stranded DNA-binding protein n=1 Tax=Acetobacterium wieringae TaxID=52694 RepID=UPI00203424E0|nr:single-stranded DNA-binding protein [Acetobacterium wieringae]URN85841.1 single-stranded DNA-binding protein [Acetobacterium wieringae]
MNKAILVGRLTRDLDVKNTTIGKAVATFTLAVDRRFKNKDGQKESDFVPIVVWGKQAETAGQYLSKGSQIGVSGRLQVRSYDAQDGQRRYVTEVVADEITFLSSKKDGGNSANTQHQSNSEPMSVMGLDEDFHLMADDDDCPF